MNKNPIDMAGTMKLNCSIVYFIATKMLIFVFFCGKCRSLFTLKCNRLLFFVYLFARIPSNNSKPHEASDGFAFFLVVFSVSQCGTRRRECMCVCVSVWYDKYVIALYVCVCVLRCVCMSLHKIQRARGLQTT